LAGLRSYTEYWCRLEFIFKTVNAIARKKYEAITEYMLAQAVLSEIDLAKNERRAKSTSAGGVR
jgi:hypothetical protein